MKMKTAARATLLVAVLLMVGSQPGLASTCSSSSGCANCNALDTGPVTCKFARESAFCTCTVSFFGGTAQCALDGDCQYTAGGGGGGGGTGSGGGGCTRTPGEWCPADCSSCTTVYWN